MPGCHAATVNYKARLQTVGYKSCLNIHSCRLRWDMEVEHSTISATSQPHGIAKFPQKEETNQIYTYNIINVLTESGQRLDHGRLVVPDGLDGGEVVVEEVDAVALEEPVGARRLPPRHLQRGVRHAHQPHVARRARGCKRGEIIIWVRVCRCFMFPQTSVRPQCPTFNFPRVLGLNLRIHASPFPGEKGVRRGPF